MDILSLVDSSVNKTKFNQLIYQYNQNNIQLSTNVKGGHTLPPRPGDLHLGSRGRVS